MKQVPTTALSIRQPWAWLIVQGHKNIENRGWRTKFRGRIFVHAATTMTSADYNAARALASHGCIDLPPFATLHRGGIIGEVDIIDCVDRHSSRWFMGPHGLVLANPEPVGFLRCKGSLGLFNVSGATPDLPL